MGDPVAKLKPREVAAVKFLQAVHFNRTENGSLRVDREGDHVTLVEVEHGVEARSTNGRETTLIPWANLVYVVYVVYE